MSRSQRLRSRLPGLLALLAVAAALNIIIAWACVLWSPTRSWGVTIDSSFDRNGLARPGTRNLLRIWRVPGYPLPPEPDVWIYRSIRGHIESGLGVRHTQLSMSVDRLRQGTSPFPNSNHVLVIECGWPLRCLITDHARVHPSMWSVDRVGTSAHQARYYAPDHAGNWDGAFQAPLWLGGNPITPTRGAPWFPLPYHVRPWHFAANTLLYFAVLATPGWVLRRVRVARRERRGLCVKCGYDVGELPVCPECGTARVRHSLS